MTKNCTLIVLLNIINYDEVGNKQIFIYYELNYNKQIKKIYDRELQIIGSKSSEYTITMYSNGHLTVQRIFKGKNWKDVTIEDLLKNIIEKKKNILYTVKDHEIHFSPNRILNSRFLLRNDPESVYLFLNPSERETKLKNFIFNTNGDIILSDNETLFIIDDNVLIDDRDILF